MYMNVFIMLIFFLSLIIKKYKNLIKSDYPLLTYIYTLLFIIHFNTSISKIKILKKAKPTVIHIKATTIKGTKKNLKRLKIKSATYVYIKAKV